MESVPLRNRIRAVIGGILRRRLMRDRDRFLQAAHDNCQHLQAATLQRILRLNADSRYSQTHGLSPQLTPEEFAKRMPVSDYESIRPAVEQMQTGDHRALLGSGNRLLMFATTSGTTGQSKLIPVTDHFLKCYRTGWQRWGIGAHQDHPELKQLRMVQLSSDHESFFAADGTPCGNISGLVTAMQKPIVRKLYVVPGATAKITQSEDRYHAALRFALAERWVGMMVTANPATLIRLLNIAADRAEVLLRDIHDGTLSAETIPPAVHQQLTKRLRPNAPRAAQLQQILNQHGCFEPTAVWPSLCCLGVWTGGSAGAFRDALSARFGPVPVRDHGLHASEGRMTIPIADETAAGLLDIESHYFEFLPVEQAESTSPTILPAHQLTVGSEYFILLTTCSGLYRYNIRDVVRCTGHFGTTPLLEFLHKGSSMSSITGEKLSESQVIEAVRRSGHAERLRRFTLSPVWGEPPGYRLYIDATGESLSPQQVAADVEQSLRQLNCEYQDKRESGRLAGIRCQQVSASDWEQFRRNRLRKSRGSEEQYKHPCLLPDPKFEDRFQESLSS